MFQNSLFAVCLGSLAAVAPSQCATLSVTGSGAPGTTLQVAIDGSTAGLFGVLLVGATQGSTAVDLGPLGSLTLGLAMPVLPLPLGTTNATGDISQSFAVPSAATQGIDVFGQGATFGFSFALPASGGLPTFGLTSCVTNVVGFHVGS